MKLCPSSFLSLLIFSVALTVSSHNFSLSVKPTRNPYTAHIAHYSVSYDTSSTASENHVMIRSSVVSLSSTAAFLPKNSITNIKKKDYQSHIHEVGSKNNAVFWTPLVLLLLIICASAVTVCVVTNRRKRLETVERNHLTSQKSNSPKLDYKKFRNELNDEEEQAGRRTDQGVDHVDNMQGQHGGHYKTRENQVDNMQITSQDVEGTTSSITKKQNHGDEGRTFQIEIGKDKNQKKTCSVLTDQDQDLRGITDIVNQDQGLRWITDIADQDHGLRWITDIADQDHGLRGITNIADQDQGLRGITDTADQDQDLRGITDIADQDQGLREISNVIEEQELEQIWANSGTEIEET